MLLHFTKMHGLGNDFMVIDSLTQSVRISPEKIRQWSSRFQGVGFDQLLLVEPPTNPDADFRYRIYNADGSEAGQCGNGARCFVRFVCENKLSCKKKINAQVNDRIISMTLQDDNMATVDMGEPVFEASAIPFTQKNTTPATVFPLSLVNGKIVPVFLVSMGNPHAVLLFSELSSAHDFWQSPLIGELGSLIQQHPDFPESCNVGFVDVRSDRDIHLRVYERGAGETLACGSGACAAMAAMRMRKLVSDNVCVRLRGGELKLQWQGPKSPIYMTGEAVRVFDGQIRL